jgi:hypothetical protein
MIGPKAAMALEPSAPRHHPRKLARVALFGFVLTFIVARAFVFLIMAREMPNFYFFLQGTHIHHLNYGIFLLAGAGGYSLFRRPMGRAAELNALAYGVGMGLTFDEFGMWLHLGGSYWQRTSVDGVIIIAALLGLFAYARSIERFESRHFWAFAGLVVAVVGFGWVVFIAGDRLGAMVGPKLHELELSSSP